MAEARTRFERDGFAVLPGLLSVAEVQRLAGICDDHRRSAGDTSTSGYGAVDSALSRDLFMHRADMRDWLARNRLRDVAAGLLGAGDAQPVRDRLFVKTRTTGERTKWHQDGPLTKEATDQLVVLWVLFAGFADGAAPLQVAVESHTGGVLLEGGLDSYTSLTGPSAQVVTADDIEARFDIVTPAVDVGDVLALHGQVLHASLANTSPVERRAYSVRFVPAPASQPASG